METEKIEARRAERKAKLQADREAQFAIDLAALDSLEQDLGDDAVRQVDVPSWAPGLPTFVVVRTPNALEYKRFQDQISRSGKGDSGKALKAIELVAATAIVYPPADVLEAVKERSPGILLAAGNVALRLAQGRMADEGKD